MFSVRRIVGKLFKKTAAPQARVSDDDEVEEVEETCGETDNAPVNFSSDQQPVVPADRAQGFGWAKASDLANTPHLND